MCISRSGIWTLCRYHWYGNLWLTTQKGHGACASKKILRSILRSQPALIIQRAKYESIKWNLICLYAKVTFPGRRPVGGVRPKCAVLASFRHPSSSHEDLARSCLNNTTIQASWPRNPRKYNIDHLQSQFSSTKRPVSLSLLSGRLSGVGGGKSPSLIHNQQLAYMFTRSV